MSKRFHLGLCMVSLPFAVALYAAFRAHPSETWITLVVGVVVLSTLYLMMAGLWLMLDDPGQSK